VSKSSTKTFEAAEPSTNGRRADQTTPQARPRREVPAWVVILAAAAVMIGLVVWISPRPAPTSAALVAARPLPAGGLISQADFAVRQVPTALASVAPSAAIAGDSLAVALSAGELLAPDDLAPPGADHHGVVAFVLAANESPVLGPGELVALLVRPSSQAGLSMSGVVTGRVVAAKDLDGNQDVSISVPATKSLALAQAAAANDVSVIVPEP
jgi:hypothetical protein